MIVFQAKSLLLAFTWVSLTSVLFWVAFSASTYINQRAENLALDRAKAGAASVEFYASGLLARIDHIARLVEDRTTHLRAGDTTNVSRIDVQVLNLSQSMSGIFESVFLLDRDGTIQWSIGHNNPPSDYSKQEYFTSLIDGWNSQFFTLATQDIRDSPLRFIIAHSLLNGFDAPQGVLVFLIDSTKLASKLATLQQGTTSTAMLMRQDGLVLARGQEASRSMGMRLQNSSRFMEALQLRLQGPVIQVISDIDGREKLAAYTRVPGTPLIAVKALDQNYELAPFRFAGPLLFGAATTISLLLLVFGMLLLCACQRKKPMMP